VTKLRYVAVAAVVGALALTAAAAEASATTTAAAPGRAHHGVDHSALAKKKHKKKKTTTKVAILKTGTIGAGTVLVGVDGKTLYLLDRDNNATTSSCTGPCATIWPALTATAKPVGATGIDKSKLTVALQADGRNQVVYAGHLLYFFSGDTVPGDAKGLGIPGWHAVSPEGAPVGGA
jgi:predicted lipoprotein with Yx(FWY)xxD motif